MMDIKIQRIIKFNQIIYCQFIKMINKPQELKEFLVNLNTLRKIQKLIIKLKWIIFKQKMGKEFMLI